jgi:hypothetical protein
MYPSVRAAHRLYDASEKRLLSTPARHHTIQYESSRPQKRQIKINLRYADSRVCY